MMKPIKHALISSVLGLTAHPLMAAPKAPEVPPAEASEAKVPDGYHASIVVRDLTFPTSVEFGPDGAMYVAEAGYSYGEENAEPRVLRIAGGEDTKVIASSGLNGPINDLLWHDGHLFVSHRGKISVVDPDGEVTDLVTDLPSQGDHHNNQLTAGPDGKIYFGQGTYTNSGVVGPDNAHMGWLRKHPDAHDVPARDIKLRDKVFESKNPLKDDDETARTRAFHAFGEASEDLTVKGVTKASGTILRMNPDGSDLEVYAWGLRNPFGVLWLPDGRLMVSENGMDARGSRPIANDKEDLYQIKEGAWYGWPDYVSGKPVTDPEFAPKDGPAPEFLMENHPAVEKPLMTFPEHSSVAKMTWSADEKFGRPDRLFVAFFGHMTPMTGETDKHGGHRVVALDLKSKETETFFSKAGHGHGGGGEHAEEGGHHGSEGGETATSGPRRLLDVEFGPDGALYIVDFGTLVMKEGKPVPVRKTGLVWKVTHGEASGSAN
jgi:glucose/arabinose dehydrogenase